MKLSRHFTLEELTGSEYAERHGIDNTPDADVLENLKVLATRLDRVWNVLALPVHISSGYRCPALNTAIGGSKTSAHMRGLAADFTCPAFGSATYLFDFLSKHYYDDFDQMILEFPAKGGWVHLGFSEGHNRRQVLKYDGKNYEVVK